MKTKLKLLMILVGIFFLTNVNAQTWTNNAQNAVIVGSTFNYKVDNNGGALNYTWSVTGSGTLPTIATPDASQTAITWGAAGTFTVQLEAVMQDGSCSIIKTFPVTVVANNSTLVFDEASISDCASTGTNTSLSLGVTLDSGVAPWTVKYSINAVAQADASLANGEKLTIPHEFTNNPGGSPQLVEIVITDAFDAYGVKPDGVSFPVTKTLTLNELPNTSEIQHD